MQDWPHSIVADIIVASQGQTIWVAYSGGVDSHVLLHCLATSAKFDQRRLRAVHVNHQLHPDSTKWAQHCADVASALDIDFVCLDVDVNAIDELGLEAAAREARYQAIRSVVSEGDVVVTAQHQLDQAETLLLQLFRGAGPKGLAAMPSETNFGKASLIRPFLAVSQQAIVDYAEQHHLQWVSDPSNDDISLNRNYLRHQIWPALTERWPSLATTVSRSADYCAESDQLMTELAQLDLAAFEVNQSEQGKLSIQGLLDLSTHRARNVLRTFITQCGLSLPSSKVLARVLDEVCVASDDAMPEVIWSGGVIRRYRDCLYFDTDQPFALFDEQVLKGINIICSLTQQLSWQQSDSDEQAGIPLSLIESGLTLRYRQGGERIQLPSREHHHQLKQLWQDWGVPPWQRDRIPLLFSGDQLIAVVGYTLSQSCTLSPGEEGYLPVITAVQK